MRTDSILCLNPQGYHRVVYQEWGDVDNDRVVVCVHGLARNSRDFDELAMELSNDYRVVCPDVAGRGKSAWLPEGAPYGIPQYLQDMVVLISRLDVRQVDWIGTSMGGLIGIILAAYTDSPIKRLVLNDIGPFVGKQALKRIANYVDRDEYYDSINDIEVTLRKNYSAFKGLTDMQWRHLAQHGSRHISDGRYTLHYDPRIGESTREASDQDVDIWSMWHKITIPQLILWGKQSDVLKEDTVSRMQQLNPSIDLVTWDDIGHAPSLMEEDQIAVISDWLEQTPTES